MMAHAILILPSKLPANLIYGLRDFHKEKRRKGVVIRILDISFCMLPTSIFEL